MLESFPALTLEALACALPSTVRPIESFIPRFGEEKVRRFQEISGIRELPTAAPGQTTATLAAAAAEHLRKAGRLDPARIDLLLFVSQTPEAVAPPTSALLHARLGLPESALALDLNQGCAGFLAALLTAAHFLQNPAIGRVLILGGDTLSRCVDPADPATAMLFGDAGFAAILSRSAPDAPAQPWTFLSATAGSEAIAIPHQAPFRMDGPAVFTFTITRVPEQIQRLLALAPAGAPPPELVLLHQANAFIVGQVARLLGRPPQEVPCRMATRGNTSSASLPLLLCDLASEGLSGEKSLLLSAFGVGFSWISATLSLSFSRCLPPIRL